MRSVAPRGPRRASSPQDCVSLWRPSPAQVDLEQSGLHVWLVPIAAVDVGKAADILDADEQARALRFVRPVDRSRFIATHVATRVILGSCLSMSPSEVVYGFNCDVCGGPHGKPRARGTAGVDLGFNVSSSVDFALVAVAAGTSVGVDIETVSREVEMSELTSFFAPAERAAIQQHDTSQRLKAAIETWTRKEAYSKALGLGLFLPLDQYEVTVPPQPPGVARTAAADDGEWRMAALPVPETYVATAAWRGPESSVTLWSW